MINDKDSLIVKVITKKIVSVIIMYGFYIIFHGEVSPGGGFQGGVVIGAAFILYTTVFHLEGGRKMAPTGKLMVVNSIGPMIFVSMGLWGIITGYSFLANKVVKYNPHGELGTLLGSVALLTINIGIGTAVGSIMAAIYLAFLEERED